MPSPARTTQIVTNGRNVPSARVDVIWASSAPPIRVSSSALHVLVATIILFLFSGQSVSSVDNQ